MKYWFKIKNMYGNQSIAQHCLQRYGKQFMSPERCILYIFSWINIICEIIWHLELLILSGDGNIDVESKANPKFIW